MLERQAASKAVYVSFTAPKKESNSSQEKFWWQPPPTSDGRYCSRRQAAIITDIGALLSHAAIVARELGIPAVVGCGNATSRLKTGDQVIVDGGQGRVSLAK